MKQSKISLVGYIAGVLVIVVSIYRYLLFYNDFTKFSFYAIIGILIISTGFLFNRVKSLENRLLGIEDYLSDRSKK